MLSFRNLIFTSEQVYWECQQTSWCEEAFWESPNHAPLYRHCFLDGSLSPRFRQPWGKVCESQDTSESGGFEELYQVLAETYSDRQLSFASDSLGAFQGILQQLQAGFKHEFYWALPISYLEDALAWEAKHDVISRNNAKHLQSMVNGATAKVPIPSWSWIGWTGRKSIVSDSAALRRLPSIIAFYKINDDLQPVELSAGSVTQVKRRIELDEVAPPWHDLARISITEDLIPKNVLSNPLAQTVLCCWTSVARCEVTYTPGTPTTETEKAHSYFLNLEQDSLELRARNMQRSFIPPGFYDFAVIRREVFRHEIYSDEIELNALCLVWNEGVAYRIGLVEIKEEQWMRLRREWRPIIIG